MPFAALKADLLVTPVVETTAEKPKKSKKSKMVMSPTAESSKAVIKASPTKDVVSKSRKHLIAKIMEIQFEIHFIVSEAIADQPEYGGNNDNSSKSTNQSSSHPATAPPPLEVLRQVGHEDDLIK